MPKRQQKLTVEQIREFLTGDASPETLEAIKSFLQAELNRRATIAVKAVKPRKYEGDARERNRQSAKQYRERKGKREGI